MRRNSLSIAPILLLAAASTTNAHTWVEYLYRISSTGSFAGDAGYPIGYLPRSAGVSDDMHQNKILDTSTNPPICKPLSSSDASQYPPLQAAAGDYIAMLYQENGHVTQPELTQRPYRGGNVYVYGTKEHQDADGINDVLNSWTADGKGGNKKGRLLATHYFDDDQCFQDAPGNPIAEERKAKYGVNQLFCQTDIQLPADLPSEGTYTLMWVWDWPLIVTDSNNVTEIYTTCAQINLSGSVKDEGLRGRPSIKFGNNNNIESAAISSQVHNLIEATTLGIGTNSPPAPTGLGEITTSSEPSTSSRRPGKGEGNIKTVTVTAEPETIIQYHTVTMGTGDNGKGENTSQPSTLTTVTANPTTTVSTTPTVTSPLIPFPTSFVPVTSVRGFLKVRAARVTGHARRDSPHR